MDLPSFLWLWKIAAWSMGLACVAYLTLATTGAIVYFRRQSKRPRPPWLRPLHYVTGIAMVALVLLLLAIGIVGTLGHFGNLGHSPHLTVGIAVVVLTLVSAVSASQISPKRPWARSLHLSSNLLLGIGFVIVTLTGLSVVQKYL